MYFIEVVPPAFMRGAVFGFGEPWGHNERGHPVYLCFRHKRGDPCEARYSGPVETRLRGAKEVPAQQTAQVQSNLAAMDSAIQRSFP